MRKFVLSLALFAAVIIASGQDVVNPQYFGVDPTSPTACTEGTGCAIVAGNGSVGFQVTVGTTPATTGTITFAHAAPHGWRVTCDDLTTATEFARTTAFTSTTVTTVTFFANGGTATAPTAADTVACNAFPV